METGNSSIESDILKKLSKYYREILKYVASSSSRVLQNVAAGQRYGLVSDLLLLVNDKNELDKQTIRIRKPKKQLKLEKFSEENEEDGKEDDGSEKQDDEKIEITNDEIAWSAANKIWRTQENNPFERETLIGQFLLKVNINRKNLLAPLLITQSEIIYNPTDSTFVINRLLSKPDLNRSLIATLLSDDSLAPVRSKVNEIFLTSEEIDISLVKTIISLIKNHVQTLDDIEIIENTISLNELSDIKSDCFIANTYVLINTPRTGSFILDDLDLLSQMDSDITGTPIEDLLTINFEENLNDANVESKNLKQEVYFFPLKSNLQQKKICDQVMDNKLTVVWGPPGTGKSETISNLVCHLIAHGKTVLVTSQQQKALEVVREKLRKNISLTSPNNPNLTIPLELALIKGEKESNIASDLKNKLDALSAYTIGINSSYEIQQKLNSIMSKLNRTNGNIDQLIKRFSELKLDEKKRYNSNDSPKKLQELREYKLLDIKEDHCRNDLNVFAKEIKKMAELLCFFGEDRKKYISLFGKDQELSKNNYKSFVELLEKFSFFNDIYSTHVSEDEVKTFQQLILMSQTLEQAKKSSVIIKESWEKLKKYYQEVLINKKNSRKNFFELLINLSEDKYDQINKSFRKIETAEVLIDSLDFSFEERFKKINLIELKENYQILLNTKYIFVVTNLFDKRAKSALEYCTQILNLNTFSWRNKIFICDQIKKLIGYIEALQIIDKVKKELIKEKIKFEHIDFNLENISKFKNELQYTYELGSIVKNIGIYSSSSKINNLFSQYLKSLNSFDQVVLLLEKYIDFEKSYLKHQDLFLKSNLFNLNINDISKSKIKSFSEKLSCLFKIARNYVEYVDLSYKMRSIPETKKRIIESIESNQYRLPIIFNKPELIIEYHRLARLYGSENIDETTHTISKLIKKNEKYKNQLIFDFILNKRLYTLYEANHSKKANSNLVKLRGLLGKKKKTLNFLKKKDSIDFSLILNYFPCWIASIDDVSRYFPITKGLFDYVIVDEASQCSQTSVPHLFYRAKNAIIVGDEKQLPNANLRFLQKGIMDSLQRKYSIHLHEKGQFFDCKDYSLLGFAQAATPPIALIEHFRCDPTIIEWSNKNVYNNMMKIMTPIWERRFNPPMEVKYLSNGAENIEEKTNLSEAKAIIESLKELILNQANQDLTLGVISPFRKQADLISDLIYKEIKPEVIKKFALQSRTVDGFQGDERDIILYSMRYSPNGKPGSITTIETGVNEEGFKRMNVAFTRARRKVIIFTSCKQSVFPGKHIKSFIAHAQNVQDNYIDRLNPSLNEDKFDSQFEKNVCDLIRGRGLTVITQYQVAGYFIDLVVVDKEGRILAVECDGDFKFDETNELPAEHYERQAIIERVTGWDVFRIPGSVFYLNPEETIENLINTLKSQPTHFERKLNQIDIEEKRTTSLGLMTNEENLEELSENKEILEIIESNPKINSKNSQTKLFNLPEINLVDKNLWFKIAHWGKTTGSFSSFQNRFCYSLGQYITRKNNLTDKQKAYGNKLLQSALSKGFKIKE